MRLYRPRLFKPDALQSRTVKPNVLKPNILKPNILKIAALILSASLLCSCAIKVGYGFLDWYIEWKIAGYVTLDRQQKKVSKRAIDTFHQWHRETQLPLYISYLKSLKSRINAGPMTGRDIHDETDKVQDLMDASIEKLMPDAVKVVHTLSDKQVIAILTAFEQRRKKYIKTYIKPSDKKLKAQRVKRLKKELKPWIGRLSDEQESWVIDWSQALKPYDNLFVDQQLNWATKLGTYLDTRNDITRLDKGLRELMFYRTDNWNPELQAVIDHNQALSYNMLARILASLSVSQRQKMNKKLGVYVSDMEYLIRHTHKQ